MGKKIQIIKINLVGARNITEMRVKVTVLLMLDVDETRSKIAHFLGIDDGTVYRHLENYQTTGLEKFLENKYFGYFGKLNLFQLTEAYA